MTAPRRIYLPPVPRVRSAGSWNPLIGFRKVVRPASVPVGRFLRPVQGIPLTGGQQQGTISSAPVGGPALVQSKVLANATSGSFSSPTTAGNCVVVVVNGFSTTSGSPPSVTGVTLGGAAGNFASDANAVSGFIDGAYMLAAIWVDYNCAGGQTAIAVSGTNLSVNGSLGITIYEFSGVTTANPLDQSSTGVQTGAAGNVSSGTTPTTATPNQVWIGAISPAATITGLPGSPWISQAYNTVNGGSGYQIVTSTGTATYADGSGTGVSWAAAVVTLKGVAPSGGPAGLATLSTGPQGLGNVWYPAQVTVQTSSGAADASTCSIYLGPAGVPVTLVGTIFPGGIGTLALAVPPLQPGDYLIAQWTGGNPGDAASMNVIGTMDSLMPG